MSRGPIIYSLPPGTTPQQPGDTISSATWNAAMDDIAQTFNTAQPVEYGGTGQSSLMGAIDAWSPPFVNIASGSTTNIADATSPNVSITGTTTITAFGTIRAGVRRNIRFNDVLTLTHNATSLILPGNANIVTSPGDNAVAISEGSGNWRITSYQRADGSSVVPPPSVARNRIVNGDMRVSQENGTTSGTTNGRYPVDQWSQQFVSSTGVLTVSQIASVTPAGSPNRLRATVTTADASLAPGEFWVLTQPLEGSNIVDFQWGTAAAKQVVVRFGFRAPAGTYAVSLQNYNGGTPNRSFVATFTITAGQTNTDTVQTVAVPGSTSGTFLTGDGVVGVTLNVTLASGSTFQGSAGWNNGNFYGTSAVSNGMANPGAIFELFDVGLRLDTNASGVYGQYEVGEVHPVYRPERYFQKSYEVGVNPGTVTNVGVYTFRTPSNVNTYLSIPLRVTMAKPPTPVFYNPVSGATGNWRNVTDGNVLIVTNGGSPGETSRDTLIITVDYNAAGKNVIGHYTASARLT